MKTTRSLNVERQAARAVEDFMDRVPGFQLNHAEHAPFAGADGVDLAIESRISGRPLRLAIEIKANGQPRQIRQAADQLHRYVQTHGANFVPVVMAPYRSPRAREAARSEQVGYLDFMGNALIVADGVYIEREVEGQPEPERRALRSLYKPKSARILRCLLAEPTRYRCTIELAEAAVVSAGLVSTVGSALRERGWAEQSARGLALCDPDALLDSWAENYEPPRGEEYRRYTTMHGKASAERLAEIRSGQGRAALASYSAAEWLAPYVRHSNIYFYADEAGLAALDDALKLTDALKGANVIVVVPEEQGVLDDARNVADGIITTGPVQTYLDLVHAGERGREGAAELRKKLLDWPA